MALPRVTSIFVEFYVFLSTEKVNRIPLFHLIVIASKQGRDF